MSYGTLIEDLNRRAATYVDKILKGANPAVISVERPTKFNLVINLKTAKALGLTFPASVLYRVDKVLIYDLPCKTQLKRQLIASWDEFVQVGHPSPSL